MNSRVKVTGFQRLVGFFCSSVGLLLQSRVLCGRGRPASVVRPRTLHVTPRLGISYSRKREKESSGFHVDCPKCSAVICRCGGLHSCCGERARSFKSRSSTFAVGPIVSDTIIIASDTSLFAVFTTDVKSIVVSLSLWTTVLPSHQFIVNCSVTHNVVSTVNWSRL